MIEKPSYLSLTQYFKGESTDEVTKTVELWKTENNEEFENLLSIWDVNGTLAESYQPDLDKAWTIIDEKTPEKKGNPFKWLIRIAASIILISGLAWVLQSFWLSNSGSSTFQANNERRIINLTDGTVVTLSKGSSMSLAENFNEQNRQVNFRGKGFFEVAKNSNHPFVVNVDPVKVKVLGTSFQIDNTQDLFEVSVTEGTVSVNVDKQELIINQKSGGRYTKATGNLEQFDLTNQNFQSWKSGVLTFTSTPFPIFAGDLANCYDVKIEVADHLEQRQITSRFEDQSLLEIFEVVEASMNVKVDTLSKNHFRIE